MRRRRRRRRHRHRHRRFCRCCGVVGLLAECEFYVTSHEFLFLLTRCYHDMDRGPLNYLIIPSISTPGTFSTQILRLIIGVAMGEKEGTAPSRTKKKPA